MASVTPKQALAHPNWSMGPKVTIDSATLMNKALELIEAHHLFSVPAERLDVLIHPQSIVHCLVHYRDGSVLAQMSCPDMRTPIAYSLAWPKRMQAPTARLDLAGLGALSFEAPDEARFPALAPCTRGARRRRRRRARCSTPPTRSRSKHSSTAASASWRSPALVEATLGSLGPHFRAFAR